MAYQAHLTKSIKHVVNRIPPCGHISCELQHLEFDSLRWLPLFEPPLRVALADKFLEALSTHTRSSNSSDHCASLCYGVRYNGVFIGGIVLAQVVLNLIGTISCSTYYLSRTEVNNMCKAHDPTIVRIELNVTFCQLLLERLHHGPV